MATDSTTPRQPPAGPGAQRGESRGKLVEYEQFIETQLRKTRGQVRSVDLAVDLMLAADIPIAVTVPEPPAIETTYRQLGQARIRTSTRDPLLRLLYVAVALILRNVWVWLHWELLAERRRGHRRVDLRHMIFRRMLLWLQHYAEQQLGICEETYAQRSPWG